jgi:cell division protein ZapA
MIMADADAAKVMVNIYGKTYTFVPTAEQSSEQIRRLASLVDERMRQVQAAGRPHSPLQTAVLAGLGLVGELFSLQTDYQATESDIAQRASKLLDSLGRVFQETQIDSTAPPQS